MFSLKHLITILLLNLCTTFVVAQTWSPLPKGKFMPSIVTTQKAIWTADYPPTQYKKATETYIDKKPTFQAIVKPSNPTPIIYTKHPLVIAKEIAFRTPFPFKDVSKLNIKYLDKAHGLFCNEITDITEDKQGLIYLSSNDGLAIYNGNSFKLLKGTNEFELNGIENLFTDSKGNIWIATYHGFAYIKDNYLYVPKNQIADHVWRIREDDKNNIWISTQRSGVFKINNNISRHYFEKNFVEESFDTYFDDSKLWLALPDGIAFIRNDSLFQYKLPTGKSSPRCYYKSNNELWIGTFYDGLQKIRNDSLFYVEAETKSRSVYEIMSDDRGLWFSSYGNGMRLITKQNIVVTINESEGLSHNGPIYFYIDGFSNIWVSDGQQGFSRIDNNILFYSPENTGGGTITDIEQYENDVWYFYNGDYLKRIINGTRYKYTNQGSEQIPQNRNHMDGYVVGKNEAWLANYNSGVVHLKDEQVTYHRTYESDYENSAINVEMDSYNRVWYLTRLNTLRHIKNDSIYSFDSTSFENLFFQDIVYGKLSKYIYAVSDTSVVIINGLNYKKINYQHNVMAVFEDAKGDLYVFLEDAIKIYHDLKLIKSIPTNLFKNNLIKSVESIHKNTFLLSTSDGILELLINDNIEYKKYNQNNGLNLSNINLIKSVDTSIIVIAGSNHYYYNSMLRATKTALPLLKIEKVLINSEKAPLNNLVIEQDHSLEFSFAFINWGSNSELKIKIDKNGKPGKWYSEKSNIVSFKDLAYGKYLVHFQLTNNISNSKIISVNFSVKPYYYQTTWFIILLVMASLVIIIIYFRYRINKAKKIELALEETIEEKTKQIVVEKNEVTKQLNEKELLLKELNHRVKNNFQMVSSLLELQSSYSNSDEIKSSFSIGINRIKSLALAHQTLYGDEKITNINLNLYLNSIVSTLLNETDITVNLEIDNNYTINIEKAQSIGFIINELITNSIKYAWKPNKKNKFISIIFSKTNNLTTLRYTDNGIGFSSDFDLEKTNTLGYTLIKSFVSRQLSGNLNILNDNGSVILITFNNNGN